jgi:RNA polymerase sigma-70 factor (ECF subfamily)
VAEKKRTTQELVSKAQKSDREALEALFKKAYPDLLQAARFRLGPELRKRMDTLDLAQAAYQEALQDLPRYQYKGKGSFVHWLLAILENKIRSQLQFFKRKRRDLRREVPILEGSSISSASRSPATQLVAEEDRARLEAAMDQLSDEYRTVIVSRYYLRMSWRDIGTHLGRSEEAAQMLCHRALAKLKQGYSSLG